MARPRCSRIARTPPASFTSANSPRAEYLFELPGENEEERAHWRAWVSRFEYLLDDLTAERKEALKARPGPPLARLAWLVLRYGRTGELARKLPEWVGLFAQVQTAPEGAEHLLVVIRYLLWTGDKAVHDATGQVLHSVLDEQRAEELMRSYGEELIEQGRQQGLEKGLVRGRRRVPSSPRLMQCISLRSSLRGGQACLC